jgi:hypothetical protein
MFPLLLMLLIVCVLAVSLNFVWRDLEKTPRMRANEPFMFAHLLACAFIFSSVVLAIRAQKAWYWFYYYIAKFSIEMIMALVMRQVIC